VCGNGGKKSGGHNATHCNTLQHTATHCNTMQHTAKHCNTLRVYWHGANYYGAWSEPLTNLKCLHLIWFTIKKTNELTFWKFGRVLCKIFCPNTCIYMFKYVCVYIYIYMCVLKKNIYIYMYMQTYIHIINQIHVFSDVKFCHHHKYIWYIYIYIYTWIYMYIYIMNIYMYIYIISVHI